MKGKYITTQILLACLSKKVPKPVIRVPEHATRSRTTRKKLLPVINSVLVEA